MNEKNRKKHNKLKWILKQDYFKYSYEASKPIKEISKEDPFLANNGDVVKWLMINLA